MPNNVNPPNDNRQVPVETYKCSQCNFYTNHEYYLEQHNLTHSLQSIMEQHKHNPPYNPNGQEQSYIRGSATLQAAELSTKPFFKTDQDTYCKSNATEYCSSPYATFKILNHEFNINEDGFAKPDISGELFEAQEYKGPDLDNVGLKLQSFKSSGSLEIASNELKQSPGSAKYDPQADNSSVINNSNSLPESSNSETTYRCDNCDYQTNLKAFLKRHMLLHTVKIEVKMEATEKYQCNQCSFETEHEKFLKRHELSHQERKRFRCQKCGFETLYTKMFMNHLHGHKSKGQTKAAKAKFKCSECAYETNFSEMLDVHKKIEHVQASDTSLSLFNCSFCKYKTNWEPCLKRHVEREHSKDEEDKAQPEVKVEEEKPAVVVCRDMFRCHDCDFSSKSKQYLVLHLKRSHIVEPVDRPRRGRSAKNKLEQQKDLKLFSCKFRNCTFQTSIKSNYVHHLRKHQSQNPQRIMFYFCDLCDFIAKTEDSLEEHKQRKHLNQSRPVYGCNQCDFKTVFKHSLKTHSIKHKVYTCDVCELEIASAYALVKHRKTHQVNPKNRIYLCDVCGFQSKNDRSLKMHKKTHNPEFKCPDCPFQTHSKVNFQNHCINHKSADEVTMFPCPHCSYQSRLKRNLAWHMKRHVDPSKAQIFKCPSCDYQTFTNAQLKSHLMVHKSKEEVVMLKCDFCSFETKRKSNMVQHRLRHLKDSPDVPLLSCPDCNYTTVAKRHLNKHRKTHNVNPDKMFQCTFCPYKIHRKIYLMRHMENHKTVETFGNDSWGGQRYTFPPQPNIPITGVTVVPNLGQNLQNMNHGHLL